MGNSQSENIQKFEQFEQIKKLSNGAIVSHKETKETYFLKESSFVIDREYKKQLQRLDKQINKEENQNIIKLVRYWNKQFNNFCSNSYKIYIIYQCPEINLTDQISAREKQARYFEECDLWSIFQSSINAMIDLKPTLSIQPSKVFILPDGLLKLIHNDMIDQQYRCIIMEGIYYAPEKLYNFNKPDKSVNLEKQSIFSLGMTLLNAANLTSLEDCYDYKNSLFKKEKLDAHLENLEKKYSLKLVQIMSMILDLSPNRRPSLLQLQMMLNQNSSQQANISQQNISKLEKSQNQNIQKQLESQRMSQLNLEKKIQQNPQQQNHIADASIMKKPSSDLSYQHSFQHSSSNNSNFVIQSYQTKKQTYQASQYKFDYKENQNLFTDPKLLQMIRMDLQMINRNQNSRIMMQNNNVFGTDKTNSLENHKNYTKQQQNVQLHQPHQSLFNKNRKNTNNTENQEKPIFIKRKFQNNSIFEGYVIKDMKHGKGKLTYPDGAFYEGEFKNDKMHGKGNLYYCQNNPAYEGQWVEDKFHGKGILYNENPLQLKHNFNFQDFNYVQDYWVKYEGHFIEDSKFGEGTLLLSNGQVFEGQFKNDCINGKGVFRDVNGNLYYGVWQQNRLVSLDQQEIN